MRVSSKDTGGVGLDVTDYKEAQAALMEMQAHFCGVVENSPTAISLKDLDGNYLIANKTFRDWCSQDEESMIGQTVYDIFPKETADKINDLEIRVRRDQVPVSDEMEFLYSDGVKRNLITLKFPIFDTNKRFINIGTIMIDVSKQKFVERELVKAKESAELANHSKSEFLANMSHELRTPLNSIIGFSQILVSESLGKLGNENYIDYARDIQDSGTHLLDIINDILDISKIEAGEVKIIEEILSLPEIIGFCEKMLAHKLRSKNVFFSKTIPEQFPFLLADLRLQKQILLNLLSNAIKFSTDMGKVNIEGTVNNKGEIEIRVSDTGIGVDEKDIPKILQPFGQVTDNQTRNLEGTGLGLPLSKSLVELHGGTLILESKVDEGTVVTVTYPRERTLLS